MATTLRRMEDAIEAATGRSADSLRETEIDEHRRQVEKKTGRRFRFTRNWPFIGRGNINGDRTLTRDQVDAVVRRALR